MALNHVLGANWGLVGLIETHLNAAGQASVSAYASANGYSVEHSDIELSDKGFPIGGIAIAKQKGLLTTQPDCLRFIDELASIPRVLPRLVHFEGRPPLLVCFVYL